MTNRIELVTVLQPGVSLDEAVDYLASCHPIFSDNIEEACQTALDNDDPVTSGSTFVKVTFERYGEVLEAGFVNAETGEYL